MKKVKLTRGYYAFVDDEDFELVSQYSWHVNPVRSNCRYARTTINGKKIYMHRLIVGIGEPEIDHINHNGFDNRRINLRACTHLQNMMNISKSKTTSKHYGVYFDKSRNKWHARANSKFLGRFGTENEAAKAIRNYHG